MYYALSTSLWVPMASGHPLQPITELFAPLRVSHCHVFYIISCTEFSWIFSNDVDEIEDAAPNTDSPHIELFQGTGKTYGVRTTFMESFCTDEYAMHWSKNIYWPFQLKSEWSFALWLLCSGLSMKAINDLFALEMVQKHILLLFTTDVYCSRFKLSNFRFALQRTYALMLRSSQLVCNGSPNHGPCQDTQQRSL